ncbi:MAG: hypothetical protein EAZ28_00680 [Oscillatoriales cyanobacterium]|nr:MAG: hypothetical protein EAZ28_00680 [Oscillatoriales cyanobacterium]
MCGLEAHPTNPNYQLPITNYQLPITNYITNYQLPITNYQLPITNICLNQFSNSIALFTHIRALRE